jgi:hypothetical protein
VSVEHLEVLVEDRSTAAAMEGLLPRMLGPITFAIHAHEGKTDLLRKLPRRLRGYASFLPGNWRILVIVDRDQQDCLALKAELEGFAASAGLSTRSSARASPSWSVVNRIAVEELEAWFFGDWEAVRKAFPRVSADVPRRAGMRDPDRIEGGTSESFERVLQRSGYFLGGLRKIEVARAVSVHMNAAANTSPSFQVLRDAILELAAA